MSFTQKDKFQKNQVSMSSFRDTVSNAASAVGNKAKETAGKVADYAKDEAKGMASVAGNAAKDAAKSTGHFIAGALGFDGGDVKEIKRNHGSYSQRANGRR